MTLDEMSVVLNLTRSLTERLVKSSSAGLSKNLAENSGANLCPDEVRKILLRKGFVYPKKNIIFHCLKGGASKTTLAYNSAYRLSQLGARVLIVDLDKQGNATQSFDVRSPKHVFVDVVTGEVPVEKAIVPVHPFLDLLPSSLENARLEVELINRKKNPKTFYRNLLAPIRDRYDIVVFDLPPDLSHNTYLSSVLADTICIPINADEYSVAGMRMTLASIEGIQEEYELRGQEVLVVWSKYDSREKSALRYLDALKNIGGARLLPVAIRTDVTFKNAQAKSKSVFELTRKSKAKEDIDILARELIGLRSFFADKGASNRGH